MSGEVCARKEVWKSLLEKNPPDGWGIDVWFLIETAMSGYQIKEIFLGHKEHTSFEDYREDVGKLAEDGRTSRIHDNKRSLQAW